MMDGYCKMEHFKVLSFLIAPFKPLLNVSKNSVDVGLITWFLSRAERVRYPMQINQLIKHDDYLTFNNRFNALARVCKACLTKSIPFDVSIFT